MNSSEKIVIIEDDESIRTILSLALKKAGYVNVSASARGDEGLTLVEDVMPDLVLLDIMLPGLNGVEICKRIRANKEMRGIRIIMLTAKVDDDDIVAGLDAGADDYVTKPFSVEVLLARIRTALRHVPVSQETLTLDGISFDETGSMASLNGVELPLTRTEAKILALFLSRPGRVYTRDQIIDATQTEEKYITDRTIDVQMVSLRHKLGDWAHHIETIRGIGYRVK